MSFTYHSLFRRTQKSLNYIHYQEGKFALGTILAAIIPKNNNEIFAAFLHQYLLFYKDSKIVPLMKGAANVSLAVKDIAKIEIPLPPINKQKKFTIFFNKLQEFKNKLTFEFDKQEKYVYQLKQSILQEAITGQLTAEWRTQNPMQKGNPDTDADALIAKIKAEKQRLIADGKLKKEKPLAEIAINEIPFFIPDNWVWCRLGELCTKIGSGSTPRGSDYSESGIPFFRSQNIHNNGLVFNDIKYISSEMHKKMNGTAVLSSDLLLNITGGSLGRCALVPENINDGNVSQHVCIIRPLLSNNKFFHFLALSPLFQTLVLNQTTGAGREGLPKYNLERFVIPLPPLVEQKVIVEKVDRLMNIIDQLEQQIKHRKQLAEDLMQTVLREAFE